MRKARKEKAVARRTRSLKKNLKELPKDCDVGTKRNSKGYKESWAGYKLHLDVVDGDIPVSGILTSASLHDSQVAIPLAQMSAARVDSLYDLMDAAYDAKEIHAYSRRLGHVPIIDHNPGRGRTKKQMDPPEKERFKERSSAERVNSNLKDNYGGRHVRVKGHKKVCCHLMFGLVAFSHVPFCINKKDLPSTYNRNTQSQFCMLLQRTQYSSIRSPPNNKSTLNKTGFATCTFYRIRFLF